MAQQCLRTISVTCIVVGLDQCTVREENGKLVAETEKFTSVKEIQGDEMVEVSGFNSVYKPL